MNIAQSHKKDALKEDNRYDLPGCTAPNTASAGASSDSTAAAAAADTNGSGPDNDSLLLSSKPITGILAIDAATNSQPVKWSSETGQSASGVSGTKLGEFSHTITNYSGESGTDTVYSSKKAEFQYQGTSTIFGMPVHNRLRAGCIQLLENPWFDRIILALILANSVTLALDNPSQPNSNAKQSFLDISDKIFLSLFGIEMIIKVIAMGFVANGKYSYIRNGWNVLDAFVVVIGVVTLLPSVGENGISALRAARLLRPLRTISTNANMRLLVSALFAALPRMADVLGLLLFIFLIFALMGTQVFNGKFRQNCYTNNLDGSWTQDTSFTSLCGASSFSCPAGTSCEQFGSNPNNGVTGFDNIGQSLLTIIQCVSLEGWVDVMYLTFETTSYWTSIYFILLIVFGAFFVVQLLVAAIYNAYKASEEDTRQLARETRERERQNAIEEQAGTPHNLLDNVSDQAVIEESKTRHAPSSSARVHPAPLLLPLSAPVHADVNDKTNDPALTEAAQLQTQRRQETTQRIASGLLIPTGSGTQDDKNTDSKRVLFAKVPEMEKQPSSVEVVIHQTRKLFRRMSTRVRRTTHRSRVKHSSPLVRLCYDLAHHRYFDPAILMLIVVNTGFMASEHHDQGDSWTAALEVSNYIFTALFTLEMIVKLIGLGLPLYCQDGFNLFDAFVVFVNWIEIILAKGAGVDTGMSALRSFRLFRLFKMAKKWAKLHELLTTVLRSFRSVMNFSVILSIFMFIYAVLGMQFLSGKLKDSDNPLESARTNFDSFGWAFVAVFQIIGGENWNDVMNAAADGAGWLGIAYCVSLFILGNYILLNLFLAILLAQFEQDDDDEELDDCSDTESETTVTCGDNLGEQHSATRDDDAVSQVAEEDLDDACSLPDSETTATEQDDSKAQCMVLHSDIEEARAGAATAVRQLSATEQSAGSVEMQPMIAAASSSRAASPDLQAVGDPMGNQLERGESAQTRRKHHGHTIEELSEDPNKQEDRSGEEFRSLFVFSQHNTFRQHTASIVIHPAFNSFILVVIGISTASLAFETPSRANRTSDTAFDVFLDVLNYITTVIFVVEAMMRIISVGFVLHSGSYLRSGWNVLDFFVVCISLIDLFLSGSQLGFLKACRALRALRPLRLIRRLPGMRVVVQSIIQALPSICNVLMVSLLFYIIFGVIGIQLFKGLFYECTDADGNVLVNVDRASCEAVSTQRWVNPPFGNFDNIWNSVLILFEIASMEMWPDMLYRAVDTTHVDGPRERDSNQSAALFFVAFIVVANFFLVNLFLGVVVDSFNEMRDKLTGFGFLTPRQQMWLEIKRMFLFARERSIPVEPVDHPRWRSSLFKFVTQRAFEISILGLIAFSVAVMCLEYWGMNETYRDVLDMISWICSLCFLIEALLKIGGLGTEQYFDDSWNRFDFFLVCVSIVNFSITMSGAAALGFDPKVLRAFRLFRMFRLLEHYEGLRRLVSTLINSLPSLGNIGSLLGLLFFIFAVMGMSLFGGLSKRTFLTVHTNFDSMGFSMLTLFRIATGESWNGIMHDLMDHPDIDSTAKSLVVPYFVTFIVIGTFLMLNLFVAVIMERFDDIGEKEASKNPIKLQDLNNFARLWDAFCERAPCWKWWKRSEQQWMNLEFMQEVLEALPPPMGLKGKNYDGDQVIRWIDALKIPVYERVVELDAAAAAEAVHGDGADLDGTESLPTRRSNRRKGKGRDMTLESNDEPQTVIEYYVHYFETMVALSMHAFKYKTNSQYRRRLRQHVRGANATAAPDSPKSPRGPAMFNQDTNEDVADEIDMIPGTLDAVQDIDFALKRRYRELAAMANRTARINDAEDHQHTYLDATDDIAHHSPSGSQVHDSKQSLDDGTFSSRAHRPLHINVNRQDVAEHHEDSKMHRREFDDEDWTPRMHVLATKVVRRWRRMMNIHRMEKRGESRQAHAFNLLSGIASIWGTQSTSRNSPRAHISLHEDVRPTAASMGSLIRHQRAASYSGTGQAVRGPTSPRVALRRKHTMHVRAQTKMI
jgi:Ion transport protein